MISNSNDPQVRLLDEALKATSERIKQQTESYSQRAFYRVSEAISPGIFDPIPSFIIVSADVDESELPYKLSSEDRLLLYRDESVIVHPCGEFSISPLTISEATVRNNQLQVAFSGDIEPSQLPQTVRVQITSASDEIYTLFASGRSPRLLSPNTEPVACQIRMSGFRSAESVLIRRSNVSNGERLMREYLLFPDKFMAFDLLIPPGYQAKNPSLSIEIQTTAKNLDVSDLATNTFPVSNLFIESAGCTSRKGQSQHPIRIANDNGQVPHSVLDVIGRHQKHGTDFALTHSTGFNKRADVDRYEIVKTDNGFELIVSDLESKHRFERYFSVRLFCSNGNRLTGERGSIDFITCDGDLRCHGVTNPTAYLRHPSDQMAFSRQCLAEAFSVSNRKLSAQSLQDLLGDCAYLDWEVEDTNSDERKRRRICQSVISGIHSVEMARQNYVNEFHVCCRDGVPGGPWLFGRILREFLTQFQRSHEKTTLILKMGNTDYRFEGEN